MAFLFVDLTQNNNKYIQISLKLLELLLLSAGLFTTLIMLKGALPPISCELVFSSLIEFKTSITCFLSSPLSILITIHVIVVSIFASSAFLTRENPQDDEISSTTLGSHLDLVPHLPDPPPSPRNIHVVPEDTMDATWTPPPSPPRNIPVVPEDTMDATWKAITGEGNQQAKKKKHLKKSETWEAHVPQRLDSEAVLPTTPKWKELRKAETFNDAVSATRRGGLIRRDPSMSIEDFNLRVDAFIKKFNDNMKLQRQESDQRFFENMSRGV